MSVLVPPNSYPPVLASGAGSVLVAGSAPTLADLSLSTAVYADWDDFTSGAGASGTIGKLGWLAVGGVLAPVAGEAEHPGIWRRTTSTTINTIAYTRLQAVATLLPAAMFDLRFLVRVNQADAETTVRFGLSLDPTSLTPASGAYLERLAADTNWFGVNRVGSAETRKDTGVAMTTAWVWLRVRRVDATRIGYTVGSAAEVTETLTPPVAAQLVFWHITNTAGNDKTVDIDRFAIVITGLGR